MDRVHPRATIRHVAEKAGCHFTTAARALKRDPRITLATRRKVEAAAKALGYMADPMMAAFSAYRQKRRVRDFQGTLAWITNFSSRSAWKNAATELYYEGAAERAHELGYKLEEFWLKEPGMTNRRASAILLNRGMRGLLLCPQPKARGHLSIHWPDFSAVSLGYSMVRPNLHLVTTAHFRSMVTMVRKLRGLGHKKIGFVCSDRANERNDRLWSAAFEAEKVGSRRQAEIPIFLYDHDTKDRKAFLKWRGQHKPDAIILAAPDEDISLWLCDASPSIAESTSIASLGLQMKDGEHAGIDERSTLIGRAAVDLVWRMLQHGERGIPAAPIRILIEGAWTDGTSVTRKNRR